MELGVLVIGEPPEVSPVTVHDEEVRQAADVAGEDQLRAVRAPRGRGDAVELGPDAADLAVPLDVEDEDLVLAPALAGDGDEAPVGREARRGVDEPERLVVAAERGLEEAALALAGHAVSQIEIDEVEVRLAEVRHV